MVQRWLSNRSGCDSGYSAIGGMFERIETERDSATRCSTVCIPAVSGEERKMKRFDVSLRLESAQNVPLTDLPQVIQNVLAQYQAQHGIPIHLTFFELGEVVTS